VAMSEATSGMLFVIGLDEGCGGAQHSVLSHLGSSKLPSRQWIRNERGACPGEGGEGRLLGKERGDEMKISDPDLTLSTKAGAYSSFME